MRDENEDISKQDYSEEEYDNGFLRWMSVVVVIVAVAGFFALAWYAYHTGGSTESAENVTLVEADKAPLKEAPADPGGLQFPHQDKTVYDAIANNSSPKPTAERILPAPEEPMKLEERKNGTETWVNDKLHPDAKSTNGNTETLKIFEAEDEPAVTGRLSPKIIRIDPVTGESRTETETAIPAQPVAETPKQENVASFSEAPTEVKEAPVKTVAVEKTTLSAEAIAKKPLPNAATRVQLGAFRSQKEASDSWNKISTAQKSLVSGKQHQIVTADLGEKGVFYRLQLSGFASADQAKTFCTELVARKQGCFLVKSH